MYLQLECMGTRFRLTSRRSDDWSTVLWIRVELIQPALIPIDTTRPVTETRYVR